MKGQHKEKDWGGGSPPDPVITGALPPRGNPWLVGHAAAERSILDSIGGGRLPHAWLITGPLGIGKATLAYRFARTLLAGGGNSMEMPPTSPVFRRVASASHADLLTVERERDDKKKRMKKTIAAETARKIPPFLHLTPAEGGWRVVIIDGAEDLNPQSANALLKILEEPPARAVLMLVCSAAGLVLPTLRSRCRHLALAPLADADMQTVLTRYLPEMTPAERGDLIGLSAGSPGRALALADAGGLKIAAMVSEVFRTLPDFSLIRAYEIADGLREETAFETFMDLLRARVAHAVTADPQSRQWAEIWAKLTRLQQETEICNLDRRQAVVAGLALVRGA